MAGNTCLAFLVTSSSDTNAQLNRTTLANKDSDCAQAIFLVPFGRDFATKGRVLLLRTGVHLATGCSRHVRTYFPK